MTGPLIVYVVDDLARPSETFIRREVESLVEQGVDLKVFSLSSQGSVVQGITGHVRVASSLSPEFWLARARSLLRAPTCPPRLALEAWKLRPTHTGGVLATLRWAVVALAIVDELEASSPALVHAHFGSAPATVARMVAQVVGCPWGVSVHARDFYCEPNRLDIKLDGARYVLACSEVLAEELRELLPDGVPVCTLHHGLDLERWSPVVAALPPEPSILAAGRFVPKKGFETLLQACSVLQRQNVRFKCALVGDGPHLEQFRAQVQSLGLRHVVELRPWVSADQMRGLLSNASVVVVPSVVASDGDRDNIPNILVESLACGVPTVASRLPAIARLVGDSQASLLVTPGDHLELATAIAHVLRDPEVAASLRARGRRLAEQHFDRQTSTGTLRRVLVEAALRGTTGTA